MEKTPRTYFITGVSGVGKTATMVNLKKLVHSTDFDIRDFDERGVPDGGGDIWHSKETKYWLDVATVNAQKGKSTIICGFNEPARIQAVRTEQHPVVTLVLLNASPETIRKRLRGRYTTKESEKEIERASGVSLEKFIEDCVTYLPTMYKKFKEEKHPIIETDDKSSNEVAQEIINYIDIN
jgi:broad-specificity NMP kinase